MIRRPALRDLPIGRKLSLAFVLVTLIALATATSFFAYTSWVHEQELARSELTAVARLIGANSTAALAFNDAAAAAETLATLGEVPGVLHAVLYTESGETLARFDKDDPGKLTDLKISSPIHLDGAVIGSVVLEATLEPKVQALLDRLSSVILALVASLLIALLAAWRLQHVIATPVIRLTGVMQRISSNDDYGIRADLHQRDEIGFLADGINRMLDHVQHRDRELAEHRDRLELEVSRRTADLEEANKKLKSELEERARMEAGLQEAHQALERSHRDFSRLSDMNDRLQVCHAVEEMRPVIAHYGPQLFPDCGGALYVYNNSRSLVEPLVLWGTPLPPDNVFNQNDCWALRQGRPHRVDDPESGLICAHCNDGLSSPYMCVPMMAYGDVMGILHLVLPTGGAGGQSAGLDQLAMASAEHLGLSLANLRLREQLQAQSVRDPLTGLFNRRYMQETLERELARAERTGTHLGVIMLDVDHFKTFNDTHGHDAGDLVLHEIGAYLKQAIRAEDIACRYGGEEIILILPGIDAARAQDRAETLREGIKQIHLRHKGQTLAGLTISLGVALSPVNGATAESLVAAADKALYEAKRSGRDRVVMATGPVHSRDAREASS